MGCTTSKIDDLPAVALCRDRCAFLDEAIRQRYSLAEAHLAYLQSLRAIGVSLHHFFDQDLDAFPPAPVISLPSHPKGVGGGDPQPTASLPHKAPAVIPSPPRSSTGSHLHFISDSEAEEDSASGSLLHHSHNATPLHPYAHLNYDAGADHESLALGGPYPGAFFGGTTTGFTHMNFMRNQATPSVTYEQRPLSPDTVRVGDASSSYYPYPYANPQIPSHTYPTHYGYSSLPTPTPGPGPSSSPSTSKQPPPPPPSSSAWDFLNPFDNSDNFYHPYTPSRDSREVREEEGIPDLEDEDFEQEVVKEVHGDQKFVDTERSGASEGSYSKAAAKDDEERPKDSDKEHRTGPNVSVDNDPVEYEVHVVDKKMVGGQAGTSAARPKARGGFKGDSDVVREIQVQFDQASEAGTELAKLLEVGKLPYNRKHATYQVIVSSKMFRTIMPSSSLESSQPSTSNATQIEMANPAILDAEGDVSFLKSKNLSSTLQKLYLWEKKLYEEVKVEERMRVQHERKSKKLKRLDEKGAEAHKIDVTRNLVRSLSSKIRIAIQVVDKISVTINKLRDEELWPLINEFIQGLTRMWKSMLECHQNQCQAIVEAKRLDAIALHKQFTDTHLDSTLRLERELLNWTFRFSCWIGAQKGYVKALNSWLMKCLLYVPEETADGIVPFSPGRIGAPPVFVVCNHWSQALERVSEKEVLDSMLAFAKSVLELWERDKVEMRQRMMSSKDTERIVKDLDREDQKIQKEMQALDKRLLLVSGVENDLSLNRHVVYQSDTSKSSSLQGGLQHIFEAMERFTANSLKVYEELLQRIEEDNLSRAHEQVS
nr:uncharacterized protein LOC109161314 [Ipomoea trifida]